MNEHLSLKHRKTNNLIKKETQFPPGTTKAIISKPQVIVNKHYFIRSFIQAGINT